MFPNPQRTVLPENRSVTFTSSLLHTTFLRYRRLHDVWVRHLFRHNSPLSCSGCFVHKCHNRFHNSNIHNSNLHKDERRRLCRRGGISESPDDLFPFIAPSRNKAACRWIVDQSIVTVFRVDHQGVLGPGRPRCPQTGPACRFPFPDLLPCLVLSICTSS
jgi:hypothetical protein